ncbi:hypothetical protein F8M41_000788 [Gigaspora margarita]|uniref:Uncharacterized protein n=1 Tax=Gigaspora margarita TaxID=4874 RepID=A0A8H4A8M5_GIGMA|nr:hypothetical protein F8M41_000788 [Gigaspora margarita]
MSKSLKSPTKPLQMTSTKWQSPRTPMTMKPEVTTNDGTKAMKPKITTYNAEMISSSRENKIKEKKKTNNHQRRNDKVQNLHTS